VSLRLYDTATRTVRDFVPRIAGVASIYLCGATVQAPPHIGHLRSGLTFDVLGRWLTHRGYQVVLCRNVTDIDDKILARATAERTPWWQIAERNQRAFTDGYRALGCWPPTVEPRATGHVPEMIELIQRLISAGHAYPAHGDVYFDVRSFPGYGALSGQRLDDLRPAADSTAVGKRDPADFALWKAAKEGEPSWDTPWGAGRPGWHLECSAMAEKYLGPAFDIHGGGLDLVFPHHENEIAQSVAAGDEFAGWWMHNAWVTLGGEKMSKSLGNSLLVSEIVHRVRPVVLRYYLVAPHYRSMIEFTEEALAEAVLAYERIEGFVLRATEFLRRHPENQPPSELPAGFAAAMDDDLATPQAVAIIHQAIRDGNSVLAAGDHPKVARVLTEVRAMLDVLGLDPLAEPWLTESGTSLTTVVDALVALIAEQRAAARQRGDYQAADQIRDRLADAGIGVEDTADGTRWTLTKTTKEKRDGRR
jgi:cysteinyl-tRNA synthetase